MQAAAAYGLMFRCDPLSVLDREDHEYEMVLALIEAAARLRKEAADRG